MTIIFNNNDDAIKAISEKRHDLYLWLQADSPLEWDQELGRLPLQKVWSERGDFGLCEKLKEGQQAYYSERDVICCQDDPKELGNYKIEDFLPVFFTRGKNYNFTADSSKLPRRQRIKRDKMIEELEAIQSGVLLVAGGKDVDLWMDVLLELFDPDDPVISHNEKIQIFIMGAPDNVFDEEMKKALNQYGGTIFTISFESVEDAINKIAEKYKLFSTDEYEKKILVKNKGYETEVGIDDLLSGGHRRLDDDYEFITTSDLNPPPEEDDTDVFKDFLTKSKPVWWGFAKGFAFYREYQPFKDGNNFADFVRNVLEQVENQKKNYTIVFPVESGAGATTLIRLAAFRSAEAGYPAVVAKPSLREIDHLALTTFATDFWRRARKNNEVCLEKPILLILDQEHQTLKYSKDIAKLLQQDGRQLVVVRVVSADGETNNASSSDAEDALYSKKKTAGQNYLCNNLTAQISREEVVQLSEHFSEIVKTQKLNFTLPGYKDWLQYLKNQSIHSVLDDRQNEFSSLFWVCLRFFLLEKVEYKFNIKSYITNHFLNIASKLTEDGKHKELLFIAFVSVSNCFRITMPLSIIMRSLSIDYGQVSIIQETLDEYLPQMTSIEWMTSEYDQELFVNHKLFAELIVESITRLDEKDRPTDFIDNLKAKTYPVEWLKKILESLMPGYEVDSRYAAVIARDVLKLDRENSLHKRLVGQLKQAFLFYSKNMIAQNPTVLQARAITLSKSVVVEHLTGEVARTCFIQSEKDMFAALKLVEGFEQSTKTEDPRTLKTTLGNIYKAWFLFEKKEGNQPDAQDKAILASNLYREVLKDWPESPYASYGFAQLLYKRASEAEKKTIEKIKDVELALEALSVQPEPSFRDEWEKLKIELWKGLKEEKKYLNELMKMGYEIGFVMKARFLFEKEDDWNNLNKLKKAIDYLEKAAEAPNKAEHPERRVYLLYQCLSRHPDRKWEFDRRYNLLASLDEGNFYMSASLTYEYAVLCYQLDKEEQGFQLFSRLRRGQRYLQLQIDRFEEWREPLSLDVRKVKMVIVNAEVYSGWCKVEGLNRNIPYNPMHWGGTYKPNDHVLCCVRFFKAGPRAIPTSFVKEEQ